LKSLFVTVFAVGVLPALPGFAGESSNQEVTLDCNVSGTLQEYLPLGCLQWKTRGSSYSDIKRIKINYIAKIATITGGYDFCWGTYMNYQVPGHIKDIVSISDEDIGMGIEDKDRYEHSVINLDRNSGEINLYCSSRRDIGLGDSCHEAAVFEAKGECNVAVMKERRF
jgi:hypothetical protein